MGAEFGAEDSLTYADVSIRVDYLKCEDYGYFVIRTFKLVHLEVASHFCILYFYASSNLCCFSSICCKFCLYYC